MNPLLSRVLPFVLSAFIGSGVAQMPVLPASVKPLSPTTTEARAPLPWLASAVIYEIFPRSFSPAGDLNGVTARLDYLQKLGVNVLWLMPINPVGQVKKKGLNGSPYAVQNYYAINPSYGTKDDLHRLIDEAHRRNMRVILDIVANHTSFDSVMMAHPEFYKHDAQGHVLSPYDWTDVAALNYNNPALRRYMTDMLLYWVKDFNLDGYRCDAAGEIPTDFWENARRELDRVHPGVFMLAEASKPELMRSAFDLDYSWPMMAALNDIFEHGAAAGTLETTLEHQQLIFPAHTMHMRMFDDHDEQRALARYSIPGSLAAAAFILTYDGVPMLYNGMEVSDPTESGAPALFEDLKVWWDASEMRPEFPALYHFLIAFRESQPALTRGETTWVHNSDEAHMVSYVRRTASEEFLISINLSSTPFRGTVEAAGAWDEVALPTPRQRSNTDEPAAVQPEATPPALPALSLGAYQFRIFHRVLENQAGAAPGSASPAS